MEDYQTMPLSEKEAKIRQIKNTPPVFIIGSQRSGTSFLYRLIQRHLRIGFGRDNGNFVRLMKLLPYYGDLNDTANLRRLISDIIDIPEFGKRFPGLEIDIDHFIANLESRSYPEIVRRFYAEWAYLKGAHRWGGKTPDYSLYARDLHALFPDARFIHIIRDGRDVALSLFKLSWGPKVPLLAARHWRERVESALNFGRTLDRRSYLELYYEDLVQYPAQQFRRLIHFIEYEGDRERIVRDFENATAPKVKRDNYNKWVLEISPRQLRIFEQEGGQLLETLEYALIHPELAGRPVSIWREMQQHVLNLAIKLYRGEGLRGIYLRGQRFLRETTRKLASLSRPEPTQTVHPKESSYVA